jgi:hypothetical protein
VTVGDGEKDREGKGVGERDGGGRGKGKGRGSKRGRLRGRQRNPKQWALGALGKPALRGPHTLGQTHCQPQPLTGTAQTKP